MALLQFTQYFILIILQTQCTLATYYNHHYRSRFRPEIYQGTRVFTLPARFYPGRLQPTIIHSRYVIPYLPLQPLQPRVGQVYPGTGMNLPNPLSTLNTYDLPDWSQVDPTFNSGVNGGNFDFIEPIFPTLVRQENKNDDEDDKTDIAVPTDRFQPPKITVPQDVLPPVKIPADVLPPVVVPPDTLPPVKVPADVFPPVAVPPNNLPPVMVPADVLPPVVVPPDTLPPVLVPADVLPPVVVPPDAPRTCIKTGCEEGHECVYQNKFICPSFVKDAPCHCKRGCRMEFSFIPLGESTIMDSCGSVCTCNSLTGKADCSKKACNTDGPRPDMPPGLVLEPVPANSDVGPSRGDFPIPGVNQDSITFPEQNFVPPIPFLATNTFPFPGESLKAQGKPAIVQDTTGVANKDNRSQNSLTKDSFVFSIAG